MRYIELLEHIDLNKTLINYGQLLNDRIKSDHSISDAKSAIQAIINADPTHNKKYTKWILQTYIRKGINYIEDMDKVKDALILYDLNKNKLPIDKRNIFDCKSISDLEQIIDQFKTQRYLMFCG